MKRIIAGRTILENTLTDSIFIADKLTEQTQCIGKNREHIVWAGELDIPIPDCGKLMMELYEEIKHGDEEHQSWLKEKIESFILVKGL